MNEERAIRVDYHPPYKIQDTDEGDSWTVWLPHQCGPWDITDVWTDATHSDAVSALKRFIREAEEALLFLEGQPEKPEKRVERIRYNVKEER